jgi:hypothetical protein
MNESLIAAAILKFSEWEQPWRFFEIASAHEELTKEDCRVLLAIWNESRNKVHWQETSLTDGCAAADRALINRFPWLIAGARAQLVRAASYQWR